MTDYRKLQILHELNVYPKRDIVLVRGKNARVWDSEGKEYIDCSGAHGTASIGHCNEAVVDAVYKQMQILTACSGTFYNDRKAELLELLVRISPPNLTRTFLCNSGAEAVEAALKLARLTTGRSDFVAAVRGFHGRTFGAMSATHEPKYRDSFEPAVPGFSHVPFDKFERLAGALNNKTAGVILEVVQGEGGVRIGSHDYFVQVQELCRSNDVLLIIDEVQTGFCRTGKMFACEHYGIEPDILCFAKAVAGGLPMGGVICSEKVPDAVGKHGSTFGGHPVMCAAAMAAINFMLENDLGKVARHKGQYFVSKFPAKELSVVREIRQIGLMIGIEIKTKAQPYLVKMMEEGVLALPAGPNVIRLLPPLTIEESDIVRVIEVLDQVLR